MTSLLCRRSEAPAADETSLLSAQQASAAAPSGPQAAHGRASARRPGLHGQEGRAAAPCSLWSSFPVAGKGMQCMLMAPGVKGRDLELLPLGGCLPGGRRPPRGEGRCSLRALWLAVPGPALGPSILTFPVPPGASGRPSPPQRVLCLSGPCVV